MALRPRYGDTGASHRITSVSSDLTTVESIYYDRVRQLAKPSERCSKGRSKPSSDLSLRLSPAFWMTEKTCHSCSFQSRRTAARMQQVVENDPGASS
jgi:hypothetical protein